MSRAPADRKVILSEHGHPDQIQLAMTADLRFLPETDVRELIVRAQAGDREAFARVIEQVQPFVYKLARQCARRVGGAPVEDLVQTGLLAAGRSVP
ncbi:MAG TPA: hypothetical protein VKE40_05630, partial [Gemmataceae bacterium]|nr:hypothetical protein [Gemmataceae bacterium]